MKKTLSIITLILMGILFIPTGCGDSGVDHDVPSCIENKIENIKNTAVRNPPTQVWKWEVDGQVFYYITSDCCDQFNYLYDDKCNFICAPDGGLTGMGDGKCPDFNGEIVKTLVWLDHRN